MKKSTRIRGSARAAQETSPDTSEGEDEEDAGWMAVDCDGTASQEDFMAPDHKENVDRASTDGDLRWMAMMDYMVVGYEDIVNRASAEKDGGYTTAECDDVVSQNDYCIVVGRDENVDKASNEWIIDSGATRHMTPVRSIFTRMSPKQILVTIANGEKLRAEGLGEISVPIDGQRIRMTDVLYVPGLDANLNRKGLSIHFCRQGVEIMQGNIVVATGVAKGKMFVLHTSQAALISRDFGVAEVNENGKQATYHLWHARLGHPDPQRLRSLAEHVKYFELIELPSTQDRDCKTCNYTKQVQIVNRIPPDETHTVWGESIPMFGPLIQSKALEAMHILYHALTTVPESLGWLV